MMLGAGWEYGTLYYIYTVDDWGTYLKSEKMLLVQAFNQNIWFPLLIDVYFFIIKQLKKKRKEIWTELNHSRFTVTN